MKNKKSIESTQNLNVKHTIVVLKNIFDCQNYMMKMFFILFEL